MQKLISQKLPSDSFDWIRWRHGTDVLQKFNIRCRHNSLVANRGVLTKYFVGWCNSESLLCRPRVGHIAVMMLVDGEFGWFHVTMREFEEIFTEESK